MQPKLFAELGLSPELLKAIDKLGFEQASPIQAESIPVLMAGHDIVGQSQTGSGKTAAFAVPAIEKVDPSLRVVQVLILCPTRELAVQVTEEVHKLSLFKRGIQALPIYGGQSYERQFFGLKQGAQIVIGTPGRVMDHMRRGSLRLETTKMVILDEADVMLNMGFREDIEFILQAVPKERQTVFFSATMSKPIRELIEKYSREPKTIRIEQKAMTVPTVEQAYYEVDRRFKIELLTRIIDIHDLKLGIIFCNTKRMVDELVDHLNVQGYSADRLHGDMTQPMRDRVMNKFRKSGLEFLVATDVAARGIDVDDVQVVFNYDLPYDAEDYLHRIGRTGRAGKSGRAISFVSGRELFQINHIERFTKTRIHRAKIPTETEVEEAKAGAFLGKIRATLQSGEFERKEHLMERLLEEGFTSTDIACALMHHLQQGEASAQTRPQQRDAMPTEAPERRERSDYRDDRGRGNDRYPAQRGGGNFQRDERPRGRDSYQERPRPADRAAHDRTHEARPAVASPAPTRPEVRKVVTPRAAIAPKAVTSAPRPASDTAKALEDTKSVATPESSEARSAKAPAAKPQKFGAPASPKLSRKTPVDRTRLFVNIGSETGIIPNDIVDAVMGHTGLPAKVVGTIDIRERHCFVDVTAEHANSIVSKLNRAEVKGKPIKVKLA